MYSVYMNKSMILAFDSLNYQLQCTVLIVKFSSQQMSMTSYLYNSQYNN